MRRTALVTTLLCLAAAVPSRAQTTSVQIRFTEVEQNYYEVRAAAATPERGARLKYKFVYSDGSTVSGTISPNAPIDSNDLQPALAVVPGTEAPLIVFLRSDPDIGSDILYVTHDGTLLSMPMQLTSGEQAEGLVNDTDGELVTLAWRSRADGDNLRFAQIDAATMTAVLGPMVLEEFDQPNQAYAIDPRSNHIAYTSDGEVTLMIYDDTPQEGTQDIPEVVTRTGEPDYEEGSSADAMSLRTVCGDRFALFFQSSGAIHYSYQEGDGTWTAYTQMELEGMITFDTGVAALVSALEAGC